MRVVIRSTWGDRFGREIGYMTDSPTFEYHIEDGAPDRESIVAVLEEVSTREMRPAYGDAGENAVCGGYGAVPATDSDRLLAATHALSGRRYPVRLEEGDAE